MARAYYFTVLVPWHPDTPTQWHPSEPTGPFSVLSRGAFNTEQLARAWADRELAGHPYTVKRYTLK